MLTRSAILVHESNSVYNNIMKTCDLSISSNYHLFKQGIKPMWEDAANKHGGKWSIQLPRNKTMNEIDNIWLDTVRLGRDERSSFLLLRVQYHIVAYVAKLLFLT